MIPEMPPLPLLAETKLEKVVASTKRMPMMPRAGEGLMELSNSRQIEAMAYSRNVGAAFDSHRINERIREARLDAKARATERMLKARNNAYRKDTRRASRYKTMNEDRRAKWVARNMLGMGTDLYR